MPKPYQMHQSCRKEVVVVKSPINIALVKYWGKVDEELIIPCNNSISITLDTESIFTQTTVSFTKCSNETLQKDTFELNGRETKISVRMERCIQMLRDLVDSTAPEKKVPIIIQSTNNFPTAAGMASSASGISALVFALWKLFRLECKVSQRELTEIARMGSGSACRSIPGGFVEWHCGIKSPQHESRSYAESIAPVHAPLNIFIYVFSMNPKTTSSSIGMLLTKQTSDLFQHRIQSVVANRIVEMKEAILSGNWSVVFELAMKDSNSFHACCLDTFPPIHYLTDQSFLLIDLVTSFNRMKGGVCRVGYSFDAGANGFVFLMDDAVNEWNEYCSSKLPPPIKCRMGNGSEVVEMK